MRSLNEKCAVVGIFDHPEASKLAYFSLHALQHRGQEAAGISTGDGEKLYTIKDRGLVTQVFDTQKLNTLKGHMAIGHTRYSTAGDDSILDAQPVFARYDLGEMSIVHNGNLTNAKEVRDALIKKGAIFQTFMDTENLIHLIAKSDQHHLTDRIIDAVKKIEGAYSLVFLSRSKMFAMRDPHGFRPWSRAGRRRYVVASDVVRLGLIGAVKYIRDVEPGELLIFEKGSPSRSKSSKRRRNTVSSNTSISRRFRTSTKAKRFEKCEKRWGKNLPKSSLLSVRHDRPRSRWRCYRRDRLRAAKRYPFEMAIMRNHYIGRTFIEPTQEMRDLKVKMKLSPIEHLIKGKSLVVIDD